MKRLAPLVLTTALLAGCSVPFMTTGKPVLPGTNQPVEPLGGVTFKPISAANARLLNGVGGNSGTVATGASKAAMPAAAPAVASDAAMVRGGGAETSGASGGPSNNGSGAFSGNVWGGYSYVYGSYFGYGGGGSNTDPMALVSITEAEAGGSKGSFQDAIKTVCAPILKAWANDPRLIQSNATLNADGGAYTGNGDANQGMVSKGGFDVSSSTWRLTYTSPARNEMLTFYVGPSKTLVLRMRWAPLSLAPELVTVDSSAAIKKLTSAITDKTFKGEEEKSGNDYFLGTSFEQPQAYNNEYSRTETVYEVSGQGMWNVSLQSILGKLVWQLDYNGQAQPMVGGGVVGVGTAVAVAAEAPMVKFSVLTSPLAKVMPTTAPSPLGGEWRESYFSNYANGMVDAQTGAVIRFSRPTRQYYRDPGYEKPMPEPMPQPSATPTATPSSIPSTAPSTEASPTPDVSDDNGDTGAVEASN